MDNINNKVRPVKGIFVSKPVMEGAGVRLNRAFGFGGNNPFDPFLLLDDFRSKTPSDYIKGFPWHPHRGIETITYVLEGEVEHGDSLGNSGMIGSGDVQWMTAGSGIIHQEMPKGGLDGAMGGFQLWANLPASRKMMEPRYRDIKNAQIPTVEIENGIKIRIISGEVDGVRGPVSDIVIDPEYLDVTMPAHAEFAHPTRAGYTVFAYVIGGEACFGCEAAPAADDLQGMENKTVGENSLIGNRKLVAFGDGEEILVSTEREGTRFLLISGRPIGEPVAWSGPIVMNTQEELDTAFRELNDGTFIKKGL